MKIEQVEKQTGRYAVAHEALTDLVDTVNQSVDRIYKDYLARIRAAVREVKTQESALEQMIAAAPELFAKPRTQVFHGIKVGFRKGTGGLDWEDGDKVVELIEKQLLPEEKA